MLKLAFTNPSPPRFGLEATALADQQLIVGGKRIPAPLDRRFDETDYSDALREARRWQDTEQPQ